MVIVSLATLALMLLFGVSVVLAARWRVSRLAIDWTDPAEPTTREAAASQLARLLTAGRAMVVALALPLKRRPPPATDENLGFAWWSGPRLGVLTAYGVVLTFTFLIGFSLLLNASANFQLWNHSVFRELTKQIGYRDLNHAFERAEDVWFQTEFKTMENLLEAEYKDDPADQMRKIERDRFLNVFHLDLLPKQKSQNPYGMMSALAYEAHDAGKKKRTGERYDLKACAPGLDTTLILYAFAVRQSKNFQILRKHQSTETACADVLAEFFASGGEGSETPGKDNKSCDQANLSRFFSTAREQIADSMTPGASEALWSVFTGSSFAPKNTRTTVLSLDRKDGSNPCATDGNLLKPGTSHVALSIIEAQTHHLSHAVAPVYRAGAVMFGPVQFVLLILFFATCVALGERLGFRKVYNERGDSFLSDYLHARAQKAMTTSRTPDPRLLQDLAIDELDTDASFPIDYASYALGVVGFIGTVIGIAAALSQTYKIVGATSAGLAAQQAAIGEVTGLLGVAFDTTLIALGAGLLVYFIYRYAKLAERAQIRAWDPSLKHEKAAAEERVQESA